MDGDAREALTGFVRAAVGQDLDRLAGEMTLLRRELQALRAAAGLDPSDRGERQAQAAELRQQGHSVRAIALITGANRNTIQADLRAVGVEPPAGQVVGLDGRVTKPRLAPPSGVLEDARARPSP